MKKIFKLSALFCAAATLFASCVTEELSTQQYSEDHITLASFGPNPAMRGGTVTFYGSNLQRIEGVLVPGMDLITDIEVVKEGKFSEIRVMLDSETPEVGQIILYGPNNLSFITQSELTYKEPIVFDSFTANAKAFPGDVITIKGTYMELIKEVEFGGGERVEVLEGASRHECKVTVPANAISGPIVLCDGAEIESLFYSKENLVMGEPTITVNPKTAVKAGDSLVVKGQHVEMIKKFTFDGADVEKMRWLDEEKAWKFALPATAKSGEYQAVSYEDRSYKAGEFEAVAPVVTKTAPTPVKALDSLVISGTNLDLVTKISCNAAKDDKGKETFIELAYRQSETELHVAISDKAIESDIVLTTDNGTEVKTALTLVHPTITSISPAELYAGDEPVVVNGTDLDLIVSATLGGKEVEIDSKSTAKQLVLKTTVSAVGGKVVLTLANGESIESTDEVSVKYHALVIVSERPAGQHIGEVVTLKGENMGLVENIFIGEEKITKYTVRTDNELSFIMPWFKLGSYDLVFNLFNGDVEKQPDQIEVLCERNIKTVWTGSQKVAWNDTDSFLDKPGDKALCALAYGNFDWSTVEPGTFIHIYYNKIEVAGYSQMRIGNGSWAAIPSWAARVNKINPGKTELDLDGEPMVHALTKEDIAFLVANNGMVICGHGYEITMVQLVKNISQETTIWEGTAVADNWTDQPYIFSDGGAELKQFGVNPGNKIYFYIESINSDYYKLQVVEGHWGPTYISICAVGADTENGKFTEYDLDANGGRVGIELTEDMYTAATTVGGWGGVFVLNGDNCQVTKITFE